MVYEARSVRNPALDRCLAEQREAKAYLESDGPDKAGAWAGLCDWVAEECLIRLEGK